MFSESQRIRPDLCSLEAYTILQEAGQLPKQQGLSSAPLASAHRLDTFEDLTFACLSSSLAPANLSALAPTILSLFYPPTPLPAPGMPSSTPFCISNFTQILSSNDPCSTEPSPVSSQSRTDIRVELSGRSHSWRLVN